ncbi:DNA repair protein RadA [Dehalococcoidia bacterium]|nr:DNA repair protein RadA [Dehalococcoidia bacterium]
MSQGKPRATYVCQECGARTPKWEGRCHQCGCWNTLVVSTEKIGRSRNSWVGINSPGIQELTSISTDGVSRINTGLRELDRVLGGGIVLGSLILVAGDPGIGKSTLLLQTCASLAHQGKRTLYISGEESAQQVRLRAERLGVTGSGLFFLEQTDLEEILSHLDTIHPLLVVLDSVQTLFSEDVQSVPGSVAQVRECTRKLMQWSKSHGVPVILAGHVTKDGSVAGPRTLEHMVDVVLYLEGDSLSAYRILRGAKNRFGSTNEIGVFQMRSHGLEEVGEPSLLFLSSRQQGIPGSVVVATMEGTRPLLAEVQALTTRTAFPQPRRTSTGVDFQRLILVTAVVSKRLGVPLGDQDIIVNIAGGLRVTEPAADLGIALSLVSSFGNTACDPYMVVVGEVGLGGEIRSVPQLSRRLGEAERMGFLRALIPEAQLADSQGSNLDLVTAVTLADAVRRFVPGVGYTPGKFLKERLPQMTGVSSTTLLEEVQAGYEEEDAL